MLQANKEELARFTEGESDPEEEDREEEGEHIEITCIEAPGSPSGTGPRRDLWDAPSGDRDEQQTEDGIVRDLGWVEYDTMQRDSI